MNTPLQNYSTEHPVYHVEVKTEKGLETKVYSRDKLKKVTATIAEDQTDPESKNNDDISPRISNTEQNNNCRGPNRQNKGITAIPVRTAD